jgi:hypothetical protein
MKSGRDSMEPLLLVENVSQTNRLNGARNPNLDLRFVPSSHCCNYKQGTQGCSQSSWAFQLSHRRMQHTIGSQDA